MVQQQQPRLPAQKFGRPSTQHPPRQQFTGQQSFIQNQNAQTNTQLSGPRQSTVSTKTRLFYNQHFFISAHKNIESCAVLYREILETVNE